MTACPCGRPSWGLVTDLCLELQGLREVVYDEQVEFLAHRLANFRRLLDGSEHDQSYHRAIAREVLSRISREGHEAGAA
jgi:hypothetical protein